MSGVGSTAMLFFALFEPSGARCNAVTRRGCWMRA